MIVLRVFLYLICIISIGWSLLVFGAPPIIKRLISGYSDGALIPSGISVSPRLDVSIGRLDFAFPKDIPGQKIEGFSRGTEIVWSVISDKPFLEINLGPSVVKDYGTADSVILYTPSFRKIDWDNIAVTAIIDSLVASPIAKTNSVTVDGILNLASAELLNVSIQAEKFITIDDKASYSASYIRGNFDKLNFNDNLPEQLVSSTFAVEDIIVSKPSLTAPEAVMEVSVSDKARNFKIESQNIKLLEFGGFVKNLKIGGRLNHLNVLQELYLTLGDSIPFQKSPEFPEITASVNKSGFERYEAKITGNMNEFELSDSDNFIGLLPSGNFLIDLDLDTAASKVASISEINFDTISDNEIMGSLEMGFRSDFFRNLGCELSDCELFDFKLVYEMNLDDEWVKGFARCPKSVCGLSEFEYVVQTSNTLNIFTILNNVKLLSPLSSLYLFGAISSGQKINDGHELKLQF